MSVYSQSISHYLLFTRISLLFNLNIFYVGRQRERVSDALTEQSRVESNRIE